MNEGLSYVLDLARRNTDALGFLPQATLQAYWQCGQIHLEQENAQPCGFLVHGAGWPVLRIYQLCVQDDARRREHGLALVRRVATQAQVRGYDALSLWCASDLESNLFWQAAGFACVGQRAGGRRRGRTLNRWMLWLPCPAQQRLFVPPNA